MENPFQLLYARLSNIEALLIDIKHAPTSFDNKLDEIGGIELAMQLTRLSKARIYTLVSERIIPHKKRGNRLTFNRTELIAWLNEGNRPTADEEGNLLPFGPVKNRTVRHRQPRSVK